MWTSSLKEILNTVDMPVMWAWNMHCSIRILLSLSGNWMSVPIQCSWLRWMSTGYILLFVLNTITSFVCNSRWCMLDYCHVCHQLAHVHEHGLWKPNSQGWVTNILVSSPRGVVLCNNASQPMMTHPPPVAGNWPIKTLVARQLPMLHPCCLSSVYITHCWLLLSNQRFSRQR